MASMQELFDTARKPLNDADKVRFPDTSMLKDANAGIGAVYKLRPDLRFGSYGTEFTPLTVNDAFPLPEHFLQVIADYIGFRCELIDDEANSGRAGTFETIFEREVMSL